SILFQGKLQKNLALRVVDNKIASISNKQENDVNQEDHQIIDLEDGYLIPALIDLQLYGTEGSFFGGDPSVQNLEGMENDLIKEGLCGFLATVATNTDEIVLKAIEAAKRFRPKSKGAFLGLHLEGPFLNPLKKGAHPNSL